MSLDSKFLNLDSNVIQEKYSDGLKKQKLSVTILDELNEEQLIKFMERRNHMRINKYRKVL